MTNLYEEDMHTDPYTPPRGPQNIYVVPGVKKSTAKLDKARKEIDELKDLAFKMASEATAREISHNQEITSLRKKLQEQTAKHHRAVADKLYLGNDLNRAVSRNRDRLDSIRLLEETNKQFSNRIDNLTDEVYEGRSEMGILQKYLDKVERDRLILGVTSVTLFISTIIFAIL